MVAFYFLQKAHSMKDRAPPTVPNLSQQDLNYASDAELLAAAGIVMQLIHFCGVVLFRVSWMSPKRRSPHS